jgi:hypothetical protein
MKTMKNITILIAALAITGTAQAQFELPEATGALTLDLNSAYIFRGATVNDEFNVNPDISITIDRLTLGTWSNFNTDTSDVDEVDLYVEISLIDDDKYNLAIGYTEYTFPTGIALVEGGPSIGLEADREVYVTAGMPDVLADEKISLEPSVMLAYGIEGPFLDESLYAEIDLTPSMTVNEDTTVSLGAVFGFEMGDNVENTGLSHITVTAGVEMGATHIGLSYVIETDDDILVVDEDFFVTLGVSL